MTRKRIWIPESPNLILSRGPCPRASVEVEVKTPRVGLEGWITAELIDAKTQHVKQKLKFKNLIVDAGLDGIGNGVRVQNLALYAAVGTDATAPAAAQTALIAETGVRTNFNGGIANVDSSGPSFAYWYRRITRTFLEAESNGSLAEVGFFTAAAAGTMWCRQLFQDDLGSPTVIVKTASDQLRITYEMRVYPPTVDVSGTISISGTSYDYDTRAHDIDNTNIWGTSIFDDLGLWFSTARWHAAETNALVAATGSIAGTASSSLTHSAYVNGNFYRDGTAIWEPGIANFGTGVGSITSFNNGAATFRNMFQTVFDPKFAKDNTKRLTIVGRCSWGRYP